MSQGWPIRYVWSIEILSMDAIGGKACLVTGAGSGIGAAIARRFAREGGVVYVADIRADAAEDVAVEIRKVKGEPAAQAVSLDVTDPDAAAQVVDRIVEQHGRIDVRRSQRHSHDQRGAPHTPARGREHRR